MLSTVFPNAIVQVETNGILEPLWNLDIPGLEIVVSPKTNHVAKAVGDAARAWKYVGKAGNLSAYDGLPIYALDNRLKHGNLLCRPFGPGEVYLQPYDEKDPVKNAANLEAVTKSCLKYGYRLSVQLHKLAGIP
jgi:organic radical activating enzyme